MSGQAIALQTSVVTDIFAKKSVPNTNVVPISPRDSRDLGGLRLRSVMRTNHSVEQKSASWSIIAMIVLAHGVLIYLLATQQTPEQARVKPIVPLVVSIIAPPSPELAPIVKQPKLESKQLEPTPLEPKPIAKPKKVFEKIEPNEKPSERMVEATTQPIQESAATKTEVLPTSPVEPIKAPAKAEPVVEDKIEPPRFGVAYLNNPAPDYPSMSRRQGEEGRVLMKVLVSADGAAEDVQLEKSSGFERLDNAAMEAVKRWRFIPAKKNGQAMSASVLVPLKFSLNN